jgi:hypothetical protein
MPQINVDEKTANQLKSISKVTRISQAEIIRNFVNETFKLVDKENRFSLGSFAVPEKSAVITCVAKMFTGSLGLISNEVSDEEVDKRIMKEVKKKFEGGK